jgi:hypothetical protein
VTARDLAARRRLLAANATLQRVRLAHDVHVVRQALQPSRWAAWVGTASLAVTLGIGLRLHARAARQAPIQTPASLSLPTWALRGLTLWRALRALRRLWHADALRR